MTCNVTFLSVCTCVRMQVKQALDFALNSEPPSKQLAKELEYPDPPSTDYNLKPEIPKANEINGRVLSSAQKENLERHLESLRKLALNGQITIGGLG